MRDLPLLCNAIVSAFEAIRVADFKEHYHPLRDGGWNMTREDNPGDHHIYTTTLALHALLELHSTGLCWREDCTQLEHMIRASADWLIRAFVQEEPAGWRKTLKDDKAPDPDISIFVYGELGRANVDLGVELPTISSARRSSN